MKWAKKPCPHGACTLVEEIGNKQIRKNTYVVLLVVISALENSKAGGRIGNACNRGGRRFGEPSLKSWR